MQPTISTHGIFQGSLSTGDITLFSIGLPVLDFGSIFKICPTFNIYAEADASIEADLEMDVALRYTASGGQLVYPSSQSQRSGGTYSPGDSSTNVQLSAGPSVAADAQLSAHLEPSIEFGLSLAGHNTGLYLASPSSTYT
uniref:Cytochrome P450 monooxygenase BOT1 (Calcineurin-dependent protein 5)) n=1 Tax=Ganoderma boninense TaxID=34458 RepID=A0A5K1K327_9APHY|nr:Cytochrome P450 monooxygenase BOT1 (EC (Botrydial biosynthesis cluster protein 1) (Calcineurin-dependent protein 5) [Ganoderma boninense]